MWPHSRILRGRVRKTPEGQSKTDCLVPKDAPQPDPDLIVLIADARRSTSNSPATTAANMAVVPFKMEANPLSICV